MSRNLSEVSPLPSARRRPLIWVIDESPTIRKIVAVTVRREGGEVIEYADARQVWSDIIREQRPFPDVVLLDVQLSRMNGYRLIQFLRSRQPRDRMAIVVLSRLDGLLPRLMTRLAGATAYLPKPFTTQQLLALLIEHAPH